MRSKSSGSGGNRKGGRREEKGESSEVVRLFVRKEESRLGRDVSMKDVHVVELFDGGD